MTRSLTPLSARNRRVVRLGRLSTRRRAREGEAAFVVDGPTLLSEALDAGVEVREVFVDVERLDGRLAALSDRAETAGAEVFGVGPDVLRRVTDPVHPRAVTAIARRPGTSADVLRHQDAVLGLIGVSDPGNAGTLVRSAVAAGFGAVVTTPGTVELFGPKALRASAGAMFHVPVVEAASVADLTEGLPRSCVTLATAVDASTSYDDVDLTGPTAVLIGNEAHGLAPEVAAAADVTVRVPMRGPAESLNAAMAGTVVCFELARQRRRIGSTS